MSQPTSSPNALFSARVLAAWSPSPGTRAVRVERPPNLEFLASQAVRLALGEDQFRPMSIASGPARPYLDFAVEHSASAFKHAFYTLAPGDSVRVSSPRGPLLLDRRRPGIMVASGIGITPFRSMLHALADAPDTLRGALVHATRTSADVPFHEEMDTLAEIARLPVHRSVGPVPNEVLRSLAADFPAATWYLAGPVEDVRDVAENLIAIGVQRDALRLEAFRYPGSLATPSTQPGPST